MGLNEIGEAGRHVAEEAVDPARLRPGGDADDEGEGVPVDLADVLLLLEREILTLANDADDEGTATLMSDYIKEQEKTVWMLNAYVK